MKQSNKADITCVEEFDVCVEQKSVTTSKKQYKSVQLFDTPTATDLLQGIKLAALEDSPRPDKGQTHKDKDTDEPHQACAAALSVSDKMFCSYCSAKFIDREDQKSHYKSDWHRFNLKQKLKGRESITEEKFEEIVGGDLSSISGSDLESEDDDQASSPLSQETAQSQLLSNSGCEQDEFNVHVEGLGRQHPKVFLRNQQGQLLAIHRCVIYGKKNPPSSCEDLLTLARALPLEMTWAILATAGGHFAGAIFCRDKIEVHKTFHRYVIRAKRGTVQSTRDKQGHAPSSGGATLRRYNEAALTQEIQELLESWSAQLKSCDRIFVRTPSYNRGIYFGGKKSPISKLDPRLRPIPFATRRPTHKEVQRIHTVLSAVDCYGADCSLSDHIKMSPRKQLEVPKPEKADTKKVELKVTASDCGSGLSGDDIPESSDLVMEEEVISLSELVEFSCTTKPKQQKNKKKSQEKHQRNTQSDNVNLDPKGEDYKIKNDFYTACKTGNIEMIHELLKGIMLDSDVVGDKQSTTSKSDEAEITKGKLTVAMLNEPMGNQQRTLLHLVANLGNKDTISLLLQHGADPAVQDAKGLTPYLLATDKQVRKEFRRFMAEYPEKYDYEAAQVPGPLTAEMEAELKCKELQRRKIQKKARKERLKDKKIEEKKAAEEEMVKQRFLVLSDREKRALAAERRLASQLMAAEQPVPVLSRCFQCGSDMTGKVPFEYMDFTFCQTKCLKEHRVKNTTKSTS